MFLPCVSPMLITYWPARWAVGYLHRYQGAGLPATPFHFPELGLILYSHNSRNSQQQSQAACKYCDSCPRKWIQRCADDWSGLPPRYSFRSSWLATSYALHEFITVNNTVHNSPKSPLNRRRRPTATPCIDRLPELSCTSQEEESSIRHHPPIQRATRLTSQAWLRHRRRRYLCPILFSRAQEQT